jgi:hypothetical protein
VQLAYPDWPDALTSGFVVLIPQLKLPEGAHTVGLRVYDTTGSDGTYYFKVTIENGPGKGEFAVRRKIPQAEVNTLAELLQRLRWRPIFYFAIQWPRHEKELPAARATLESLRRQAYAEWRLTILRPTHWAT